MGCQKAYLDTKPDKALLIPTTVGDMQALLDNSAVFNVTPALSAIADGDFFTTDAGWKSWTNDVERNCYTWSADIWGTFDPSDWQLPYRQVFYANVVLDGLKTIYEQTPGYASVKGTALFSRAFAYYNLLQEFTVPYLPAAAPQGLGLAVRLTGDVTGHPVRSTLQGTYDQVLKDLLAARSLLPVSSSYKSRPVVAAAYAMLARVYLVMGNYELAGKYADSCLTQRPALIDYNTLSTTATRPFPRAIPNGNDEVIYYAAQVSFSFASNAATLVDSGLYRSYAANDLRRILFFKSSGVSGTFKGNYGGIIALFSGLTTDEMYLTKAECAARQQNASGAMETLNNLLVRRWKKGTFMPLTANDAGTALAIVLTERRKELVGRNIRWSDLKRLNQEERFAQTLVRRVNGAGYMLLPGSRRYAFPLPLAEIQLGNAVQNER